MCILVPGVCYMMPCVCVCCQYDRYMADYVRTSSSSSSSYSQHRSSSSGAEYRHEHHRGNRWWGSSPWQQMMRMTRDHSTLNTQSIWDKFSSRWNTVTDRRWTGNSVAELRQSVSCIVYGEHLLVLRTIRVLWDVFTATRFNRQTCTSYTDIVIFDITAAGCYVYNSSSDYLDMFPLMWRLHLKLSYAESRSHLLEESGWDSLLSIARQSFELASVQWVTLHVSSILFL